MLVYMSWHIRFMPCVWCGPSISGDVLFYSYSGNIYNVVCGSHPPFHTSLLL